MASCDAKGVVKLWDVRTIKSLVTLDFGPYSANSVSFHPAGTRILLRERRDNKEKNNFSSFQGQLLTTASSDRTIKLYNIGSEQVTIRGNLLFVIFTREKNPLLFFTVSTIE